MSDKKIKEFVSVAKANYNIDLVIQIENDDGCELSTRKVIYISFNQYQSDQGRKCYEYLKENKVPIYVKGPTSVELLGNHEPYLNIDYLYQTFYSSHVGDIKQMRSNARFHIRTEMIKSANRYYFKHYNDPYWNFGLLWDDVLKYTSVCGQHINEDHLMVLKQSVEHCVSEMKEYHSSGKHMEFISELKQKFSTNP